MRIPATGRSLANGFNVMRALVLFGWEVVLEWTAASRANRRDVQSARPPGRHVPVPARSALRGRARPDRLRACSRDMMRGRPAVYATFSSYDEVAHHSGLERADTLEALRKLDQQFGRIERALPLRPAAVRDRRPLRPRPDAGRDLQATQRLRPRRARRAFTRARRCDRRSPAGRAELDGRPRDRRGDRQKPKKQAKNDVSDRDVIVLGSGNLGLVYLMDERRRLTLEELNDRHPRLLPALRNHPHVGWLLVRSEEDGPVVLGAGSALPRLWPRRRNGSTGTRSRRNAPRHVLRTDGFAHVADIMVGSFYDPAMEEGCAFEELISLPRRARRLYRRGLSALSVDAFARLTHRSSARRR